MQSILKGAGSVLCSIDKLLFRNWRVRLIQNLREFKTIKEVETQMRFWHAEEERTLQAAIKNQQEGGSFQKTADLIEQCRTARKRCDKEMARLPNYKTLKKEFEEKRKQQTENAL